jgi:hypothetical protein
MKAKFALPMDARKLASKPVLTLPCAVNGDRYLKMSEGRQLITFQFTRDGLSQDVSLSRSHAELLFTRLGEMLGKE